MTVVRSEEILKPNTVQVALNVRDNNRSVVISQSHVKQTELIKINEGQDGEEELINFPLAHESQDDCSQDEDTEDEDIPKTPNVR